MSTSDTPVQAAQTQASSPENSAEGAKAAPTPEAPPAAPAEELLGIDQFAKIKLRVGQIIEAERVEKSEKLLKLKVNLGEERGPRQILAGIGKHYAPESIIGRKIVVVANLKPAKLMGQLSEGMLLAASDDAGNLELLSPGDVVPAGSVVR